MQAIARKFPLSTVALRMNLRREQVRWDKGAELPDSIDILDLPGLRAFDRPVDNGNGKRTFHAIATEEPKACENCGGSNIYKHGVREREYLDTPIHEYQVVIRLHAQRFRCRDCKATFVQPVKGVDSTKFMTARCVAWIRERCLCETYVHVAGEIGCDEKTVREIAEPYIEELNNAYHPYLPEWLGIDETSLGGENRCVLTNIGQHRPIDLLPDREISTVIQWLYDLRGSSRLQGVTMDMWRPFWKAVKLIFPDVPVVIDKFHVLQMASAAMDKVRTTLAKNQPIGQARQLMRDKALLRKRGFKLPPGMTGHSKAGGRIKLDGILESVPELREAYDLKESFAKIYDSRTRQEAEIALDKWRDSVPKHLSGKDKPFQPLLTATKNWRTEILAYFDLPFHDRKTNAYTETLNSIIKVDNRQGRGYNFKVLRARVLFKRPPVSWRKMYEGGFWQLSAENIRTLERILHNWNPALAESVGWAPEANCWDCGKEVPSSELSVDAKKGDAVFGICRTCQDNALNTTKALQEGSQLVPQNHGQWHRRHPQKLLQSAIKKSGQQELWATNDHANPAGNDHCPDPILGPAVAL